MCALAARKAFGENASVLPVPRRTAAAPIASAVRIIVPRLPGSCNASSAAISPCGKSSALSGAVKSGVLTAAAIPAERKCRTPFQARRLAHGKKLRTECRNPCFKIRASLLNKQRFRHNARLQRIKNKPFTLDKVLPALTPRRTIPAGGAQILQFRFLCL